MAQKLTVERLRQLLRYDHSDGEFYWLVSSAIRIRVGDQAGSVNGHGRKYIKVDGAQLPAHRLAWLYVHGSFPQFEIDHIDGNPLNNRIENLRDVPGRINAQNRRQAHSSSKSGVLGVTRKGVRWKAQIAIDGRKLYLGTFDKVEQASGAYMKAKRELHSGCTV